MKAVRCPYHVKQGIVDAEGRLVLSDVCGVRSAACAVCPYAPFSERSHKECDRFLVHTRGADRQILVPKNDIEYLPEVNEMNNFSEIDLL